jgi:hypothetical protein
MYDGCNERDLSWLKLKNDMRLGVGCILFLWGEYGVDNATFRRGFCITPKGYPIIAGIFSGFSKHLKKVKDKWFTDTDFKESMDSYLRKDKRFWLMFNGLENIRLRAIQLAKR